MTQPLLSCRPVPSLPPCLPASLLLRLASPSLHPSSPQLHCDLDPPLLLLAQSLRACGVCARRAAARQAGRHAGRGMISSPVSESERS
eukprot:3933410-Rhodomonas_salina.6